MRTYADREKYINQSLMEADWLRTLTWDLPTELRPFLGALGFVNHDRPEEARAIVEKFLTYPAVIPMPESLWNDLAKAGLIPKET